MLHHRHELDVREPQVVDIGGEFRRQFAVAEPAVALLHVAHPRAQVHFVHRNRRVPRISLVAQTHPLLVGPLVIEVPHDRARARRRLVMKPVRVGLVDPVHVKSRTQVVLVDRTLAQAGDEALPHPRMFPRSHGVGIGVPAIEVADHRDAFGIRRPYREVRTRLAVHGNEMRTQLLIQTVVASLIKEVKVQAGQQGGTGGFRGRWCHDRELLTAEKPNKSTTAGAPSFRCSCERACTGRSRNGGIDPLLLCPQRRHKKAGAAARLIESKNSTHLQSDLPLKNARETDDARAEHNKGCRLRSGRGAQDRIHRPAYSRHKVRCSGARLPSNTVPG